MRIMTMLVTVLVLAGCVLAANYQAKLQTWVGKSEIELVESIGPPDSWYEVAGSKFISYNRQRGVTYIRTVGPMSAVGIPSWCKTTFQIRDSLVSSWQVQGNACRSR